MTTTDYLGDPGERLAAASLWQAMLGELHPATSNDDDDKVDHRLVYPCPFTMQRRELRCQIKTGNSFGTWTKTKNRFRIDLDDRFRAKLRANDSPTLLVWIPQADRQVFYALIPPRRNAREPVYIVGSAIVSPAMLFDVARRQLAFDKTLQTRRIEFTRSVSIEDALKKLKLSRIKESPIQARVVRNLRVSSTTLRHITRTSRPAYRRRLSCDAAPYLRLVLAANPGRAQYLTRDLQQRGTRSKVNSLLLLEYPRAFRSNDKAEYSLFVRIREVVSFPLEWRTSLLCLEAPHSGAVNSRAVVESWYLKRHKKS